MGLYDGSLAETSWAVSLTKAGRWRGAPQRKPSSNGLCELGLLGARMSLDQTRSGVGKFHASSSQEEWRVARCVLRSAHVPRQALQWQCHPSTSEVGPNYQNVSVGSLSDESQDVCG